MSFSITKANLVNETGGIGDKGVNYVQTWQVYFTGGYSVPAITYGTFTDATFGPLPKKNATHTSDSAAYVADIKIEPEENDGAFGGTSGAGIAKYTVTYAQKQLDFDPNPLSRPPVIEWSGTDLKEVPRRDVDDNAILNSAGQMFTGVHEYPIRGACDCLITRNEASNPGSTVAQFSYTINNASWHGFGSNTALIGKIHAGKKTEVVNGTNLAYWEVAYPVSIRQDGWREKLFDNGLKQIEGTGTNKTLAPILDNMGHEVTTPALLDGSGKALPWGSTNAVFFPTDGFKMLVESNFGTLSLPDPTA